MTNREMTNCNVEKISINSFLKRPSLKQDGKTKLEIVEKWLSESIVEGIRKKKFSKGAKLPQKAEIANFLHVGVGTVQNAIRSLEDKNLLFSKQKKGTFLSFGFVNETKADLKRDQAASKFKLYLLSSEYKEQDILPPLRTLSEILKIKLSTLNNIVNILNDEGVLEKCLAMETSAKVWKIKTLNFQIEPQGSLTVVEKLEKKLEKYFVNNFKDGQKLPSNKQLAKLFKTSAASVNEAICTLKKKKIVVSKRGNYGTFLCTKSKGPEFLYKYQEIEKKIFILIQQECELMDKLPSMEKLAKMFNAKKSNVARALKSLNRKGIVQFKQGRFGGTFVCDLDGGYQDFEENQTKTNYKWLAKFSL